MLAKTQLRSISALALALFVGSSTFIGCGGTVPPEEPLRKACSERDFVVKEVERVAVPNVVRILAGKASGTGFVLASPGDKMLIVTNLHVVADADELSAKIQSKSGEMVQVAGLKIAKVDTKNDLVLLEAPALMGMADGLHLNPDGAGRGQRVAAMGYPYVAGADDFSLTVEPGDVTAVDRSFKSRQFMQVNANINPGNSGGPVVDACGTVVGVVTAMHKKAERVGLIVPGAQLAALHRAYLKPVKAPKRAISAQLEQLEQAVQYRKGSEAAALFSRRFLLEEVGRSFVIHAKRVMANEREYARVLAERGYDYRKLSFQQRAALLKEFVAPREYQAWLTAQLLSSKAIGMYEGLTTYLSMWITDVFGDIRALQVQDISQDDDESGIARVKIVTDNGSSYWEFAMVHEWGDWRIASTRCARGCS